MNSIPPRGAAQAVPIGIALVCAWIGLHKLADAAFPQASALIGAILGLVMITALFKYCVTPLADAFKKRRAAR